MKIVSENELLDILKSSKSVFLLEPPYKRKFPPTGLMKIASFIKCNGGTTSIGRHYNGEKCDLICITTLFSYDYGILSNSIEECLPYKIPIIIGGVFASSFPKYFEKWNIDLFQGFSIILENYIPDYKTDWGGEGMYRDASLIFTTRGCKNSCKYCIVKKVEPKLWINPNWKNQIISWKKYVVIRDNNIFSFKEDHTLEVLNHLIKLQKPVIFDTGIEAKLVTNKICQQLGKLKYAPNCGIRTAFDRMEDNGIFQFKIKEIIKNGVNAKIIAAFILFNFKDTPQEANYRLGECLNLGIKIYPQQYTPLSQLTRKNIFIGKYWTKTLTQAFRFYGNVFGIYNSMTFEEFLHGKARCKQYTLTRQDWDAFYYQKEKYN